MYGSCGRFENSQKMLKFYDRWKNKLYFLKIILHDIIQHNAKFQWQYSPSNRSLDKNCLIQKAKWRKQRVFRHEVWVFFSLWCAESLIIIGLWSYPIVLLSQYETPCIRDLYYSISPNCASATCFMYLLHSTHAHLKYTLPVIISNNYHI